MLPSATSLASHLDPEGATMRESSNLSGQRAIAAMQIRSTFIKLIQCVLHIVYQPDHKNLNIYL